MDEDPATQAMTQEQPEQLDTNSICTLVCTNGAYLPGRMVLTSEQMSWAVGRSPEADFCIGPSKRLSNTHFVIFRTKQDPGTLLIKDKSTNGTYLNNLRLQKGQTTILSHGDEVAVGVGVDSDVIVFMVSMPRPDDQVVEGVYADYTFGATLGTGAFATVKKAVSKETGETFAVKIISKSKLSDGDAVQREIQILKQLKNAHVVAMYAVYEDSQHFYLIMDYVKGGDLMDFVLNNGSVPEVASREIIRQICEAVKYVHSLGISHRDLKPDNILIAEDSPVQVKVSDFGLAKISAHQSVLKTFCGTLAYLAPEVMETKGKRNHPKVPCYSNLVDMWSIGCLAFVIMTGYLPFEGQTQDLLYTNVSTGNYNRYLLKEMDISQQGIDFIDAMLQVDPLKRPSAEKALKFPWLVPYSESDSAPNEEFSTMNIDTSSSVDKHQTVRPHDDKENEPMPDLANDSESEDKPTEANTPGVEQTPAKSNKFSIRDMNEEEDEGYPSGTWMTLDTRGDSVPCRNIEIRMDQTIMGRGNVDVEMIKDPRISKRHCVIDRVYDDQADGYRVWLRDMSTNGCFVNGTSLTLGHKAELSNGDTIYLFSDTDNNGKQTFLGFTVKFVATDLVGRESVQPEIRNDPDVNQFKTQRKSEPVAQPETRKRPRQLNSHNEDTMRPLKKMSVMK